MGDDPFDGVCWDGVGNECRVGEGAGEEKKARHNITKGIALVHEGRNLAQVGSKKEGYDKRPRPTPPSLASRP